MENMFSKEDDNRKVSYVDVDGFWELGRGKREVRLEEDQNGNKSISIDPRSPSNIYPRDSETEYRVYTSIGSSVSLEDLEKLIIEIHTGDGSPRILDPESLEFEKALGLFTSGFCSETRDQDICELAFDFANPYP